MSEILQRIGMGNGWQVTFVGMVGVFAALLMIYLFIAWLRRLMKEVEGGRKDGGPGPAPHAQAAAGADKSADTGADTGACERLAAVAAAAWLVLRSRRSPTTTSRQSSPSGWRMAGRLELMRETALRAPRKR